MSQSLKPESLAAREAIALMGGPVQTAVKLNVGRYQTVQSWARHGVPVEYCADVERETQGQVTRQRLQPAKWLRIWPELAQQPAEQGV